MNLDRILDTIAGKPADPADPRPGGVAQAPTHDDHRAATVEQLDTFVQLGNVVPIEGETPDSITDVLTGSGAKGSPTAALGVPVPGYSVVMAAAGPLASCGLPVQVVPASGGRARTVTLVNTGSASLFIYTDRRDGLDLVTPAPGGFEIGELQQFTTTTQGPIYAAAATEWSVAAWVDNYAEPVTSR